MLMKIGYIQQGEVNFEYQIKAFLFDKLMTSIKIVKYVWYVLPKSTK